VTQTVISVRAVQHTFALALVDNFDYPGVTFVRGWYVYADDALVPGMCVMQAEDGRMYGIHRGRTHVIARSSTATNVAYGMWRRTEGASCS